jgi:hypothetical protein
VAKAVAECAQLGLSAHTAPVPDRYLVDPCAAPHSLDKELGSEFHSARGQ